MTGDLHTTLLYGFITLIYFLPAVLVGVLAFSKGRSITAWLLITIFTGVVGLAILALLPPTQAKNGA